MSKKIFSLEIIFSLAIAIIGVRLGYVQIIKNNVLLNGASDSWQRSFPLVASRGYIYDRTGVSLAINVPTMSLAVIPYQVKEKAKTSVILAPILEMDAKDIYEQIDKKISIVRLKGKARKIDEETAVKINNLRLDGVYLLRDSTRYYPYESMLAHTLGFVGIDNQGLAGIEAYYNNYLQGTNGYLNYYMDAKGGLFSNLESNIISPGAGMSLNLTIDYNIQSVMERELYNAYLKYSPQSVIGIAMNPKNGELLAIVNYPTFNPNNYQIYNSDTYNRNLAIWKSYEPGSTFKVFSFAAALEEKVIDMYKDTYYDTGSVYVEGQRIKSWKKGGHGLQTYLEVLQNSSNPGFVSIAQKLGKDNLFNYITNFGFGSKTGIDIWGESAGIMFGYDNYNLLEQATTAFGQGVSVTALQLVTAFSAVINGGYLYTPSILDSVSLTSTGEVIYEKENEIKRKVISNETSALMRDALEHVVSLGGGRNAYIDGYRVGGKTGTAQKAVNGVYQSGNYNLSMIAAAPMDDPQVVVYVAIDNPKSAIQYGGTVAGPIVKAILSDVLPYLGVSKRSGGIDKTYTWMDTKTYKVENYVGLEKNKVKSQYFKFEFIGEGNTVIDQLPKYGERVEEGSTIVVMLG
jgi:stage V sporulation protein D (sporulation-specific penicillin-binding protein)